MFEPRTPGCWGRSTVPPPGSTRRASVAAAATGFAPPRPSLRVVATLSPRWGSGDVLEAEPAAPDANRATARLLAETDGPAAASGHLTGLRGVAGQLRAPPDFGIEWLRGRGDDDAEPAVRRLLEIHPADAWGHRELALVLSEQGRHDEAAAEMEMPRRRAVEHERGVGPGLVLEARRSEARGLPRGDPPRRGQRVGHRPPDRDRDTRERREASPWIEGELERQVTFGDGLLAFAAAPRCSARRLLASLRRAREARPDLWHAWSALIRERSTAATSTRPTRWRAGRRAVPALAPGYLAGLAAVMPGPRDRDGEHERSARPAVSAPAGARLTAPASPWQPEARGS